MSRPSTSIPRTRRCRSPIRSYYAMYLAKRIGPYATLGLAEDTWALNEGVIDDGAFLQQAYDIDASARRCSSSPSTGCASGALVCVFDATDRIQHMFWRYLDRGPPGRARRGTGRRTATPSSDLYRHNDELVGRVHGAARTSDDVLMVVSDHGFASFRRGVNLNTWLLREGLLALNGRRRRRRMAARRGLVAHAGLRDRPHRHVPQPRRARGAGHRRAGRRGRGAEGRDHRQAHRPTRPGDGARSPSTKRSTPPTLYNGPYLENAPDLIIGYNAGYRVSWDGATGVVAGPVFEDNTKAWSGDHCVDPRLVPGVFFCNRPIEPAGPRARGHRAHRACGCSASSRPPTWTGGRWRVSHEHGRMPPGRGRRVRRRAHRVVRLRRPIPQADGPARHRARLRRHGLRASRRS